MKGFCFPKLKTSTWIKALLVQIFIFSNISLADTLGGTITLTYIDYPDDSHQLEYALQAADGSLTKLQFAAESLKEGLNSGTGVMLEGSQNSDGVFLVESAAITAQLSDAELAAAITGQRTTIVIMVNLSDANVTTADCDATKVTERMYTADESVKKVMEDSSYGTITFPGSSSTVVGPFTIASSSAVCDPYGWASLADTAATNSGVNLADFQHRVYVLPRYNNLSCNWAGLGNVGCSGSFCRSWIAECESPVVYAHELGHNLGMAHASTDPEDDETVNSEYGDSSCIMGSSRSWKHFNAAHKDQMGWLSSDQLEEVTPSTSESFNLYALNLDPSATAGPQALKLADGRGSFYYLSFREETTLYDGLSTSFEDKVNVHAYVGSGYDNTKFIDGFSTGESYELGGTGVTLTVSAVNDGFATVVLGSPDTDGDGKSDIEEANDGTNPNDPASIVEQLRSPVNVLWNGFLSMTNILEMVNPSNSSQPVTVKLYNAAGTLTHDQDFTISANSQLDLVMNTLVGFEANSYGVVQVEFTGTIDGRASYYRSLDGGSSYEFAYSVPFSNPKSGTTALSFNTFNPSTDAADADYQVLNWLTLVNLANQAKDFTVLTYNQVGTLLATRELTLEAFGRADVDGGHGIAGPSSVGFHRVVPADNTAEYIGLIKRYSVDPTGSSYKFAFPLLADAGITDPQWHAPLSRQFGEENWVEVTNISDAAVSVTAQFFSEDGTQRGIETVNLGARSQINYYANAFINNGETGFVMITPGSSGTISAQSMVYFTDASSGSVTSIYGSQALSALGATLNGSYNLFLDAQNWLRLSNTTANSVTVTVDVDGVDEVITLGAFASTCLPIHDSSTFATTADSYGFLNISSSTFGIMADLIRLRTDGSIVDFSFPTKVRPQ